MSFDKWALLLGLLLLALVFVGSLLSRLPLTGAMVYLAVGWLLGPDAVNALQPDPLRHAGELERLAEVALLISLFAVGLRLGVPLRDRRWWRCRVSWCWGCPRGLPCCWAPSLRRPTRCWPRACNPTPACSPIAWASAWPEKAGSTMRRLPVCRA